MINGKWKKIGAGILCACLLTACGKDTDAGAPDVTQEGAPADGKMNGADSGKASVGGKTDGTDSGKTDGTDSGKISADGKTDGTDSGKAPADEKADGADSGNPSVDGEESSAPQISFEIRSVTRLDSAGNELVFAQYPVFSVSGEGYEALAAVFTAWNVTFEEQAVSFLDAMEKDAAQYRESVDASYQYGQKISVNVARCDGDFVSILVMREVEEGGPHPNHSSEALNFSAATGTLLKLADVITVDDALREKINTGLHTDYPELEFDEEMLKAGIADALDTGWVEWYFTDGQICFSFPEGSFGFGHAEGSLGVLLDYGGGAKSASLDFTEKGWPVWAKGMPSDGKLFQNLNLDGIGNADDEAYVSMYQFGDYGDRVTVLGIHLGSGETMSKIFPVDGYFSFQTAKLFSEKKDAIVLEIRDRTSNYNAAAVFAVDVFPMDSTRVPSDPESVVRLDTTDDSIRLVFSGVRVMEIEGGSLQGLEIPSWDPVDPKFREPIKNYFCWNAVDHEWFDDISAKEDVLIVPAKQVAAAPQRVLHAIHAGEKGKEKTDGFVCCDEGNNIYLKKKDSAQEDIAEEAGEDTVIFSPSGKKAELVPVEGEAFPVLEITLEDGTKKKCELTNVLFTSVCDFYWIGEDRVVLEGHVNPSLNVYIVYDLKENDFKEYNGLFFTWNHDNSKLFYVQPAPHFGAEAVPEKIIDQDGTVYYETWAGEHFVDGLILDATSQYMGFYVRTTGEDTDFWIINCETMAVLYEEAGVACDEIEIIVETGDHLG